MRRELNLNVERILPYNIKKALFLAKILNDCGRDMAQKYGLHHWDNSMIKSCLIVGIGLLKNRVYLVSEGKNPVATFQVKKTDNALFFEKLAVSPEVSGKGYGSYCMRLIEKMATKLGCERVQMEVYDQSRHAIEFYQKRGYLQVGKTGTRKYTDLVMEKIVGN